MNRLNDGFTFLELIAVMALIALLISTQLTAVHSDDRQVKLDSAVLYAQQWVNAANRARQSGLFINGDIYLSALADYQAAPLHSPFGTPYQVTMTAVGAQVSFSVPFAAQHILTEAIPLPDGHTVLFISPTLNSPSTAAVEKQQFYRQSVVL